MEIKLHILNKLKKAPILPPVAILSPNELAAKRAEQMLKSRTEVKEVDGQIRNSGEQAASIGSH